MPSPPNYQSRSRAIFGTRLLARRTMFDAAYSYSHSFDYRQAPLAPVKMTHTDISSAERQRLRMMPHPDWGT